MAVIFAILFFIFHQSLPSLYLNYDNPIEALDNLEVATTAATLLLIAAVFQISDTIQVVTLGALRGMQDVKLPTLITFVAYWVVGFPVMYYLGLHTSYGSAGIWIGLLAGLTVSGVLLSWRFHVLSKELIASS